MRGVDNYQTFKHEPRPARDLDPEFVALHQQITDRNAKILYKGADGEAEQTTPAPSGINRVKSETDGTGFVTILVAGLMNGSFAVPMKWTRKWAVGEHLACLVSDCPDSFPLADDVILPSLTRELYRQSDHAILVWFV